MKILYLNIYEGCQNRSTFNRLIRFVKTLQPDLVGLSELNGWDKTYYTKLQSFKHATKLHYSAFAKAQSGYHLGLFSRTPLQDTQILTQHFNTGVIQARIEWKQTTLSCILTHLHYQNEDKRLKELSIILKKIQLTIPTLLMGDLNSLSPQDTINTTQLLQKLHQKKLRKFGTQKIRTDVLQRLLKRGFIDVVRAKSRKFEYSVPTQYNQDPNHLTKLRLDYVLVTKNLWPRIQTARIVRNAETNAISDHFPIFLKLLK